MDKIDNLANGIEIYSTLPWHKKIKKNLRNWFEEKILGFKVPWKKIIALVVIVLFGFGLYIVVKANQVSFVFREEYNKSDFLEATEFQAVYGDEIIIENENMKLVFDTSNTLFSLVDKRTEEVFESNPDTRTARFLEPFRVFYSGNLGSVNQISVYSQAISYDDFLLKLTDEYLEVLYLIGGKKEIDANDFPQIISDERMQSLILSKLEEGSIDYRRITEQAYVFGEVNGVSIWKLKDGIQRSVLQRLYNIMYELCGYTVEDLIYDQESNGIKVEDKYPYFEIAVRYSLNSEGLDVKIINDSIVEKEKYPLLYIDVLPYFGAGSTEDMGYIVIPDGSGGVIEFNQQRAFALPYNKRIYGEELAISRATKKDDSTKISLPVIGIKKNQSGFIAVAKGAVEMTNVYASSATQENPYNQAFYRYYIREGQPFEFSSINSSVVINQWTIDYNKNDFIVSYLPIDKDDANYSDMAQIYRDYLVTEDLVVPRDNTDNPVVDLTLLGGYIVDENFLGIPYKTVRTLTNTDQAIEILERLSETNLEKINVYYQGFSNQGLKPAYMGKIRFDSRTGSLKDFQNLIDYSNNLDIDLYLETLLNTAYTKKNISTNNEAIRDVFGQVVYNYDYNPASLYLDNSSRERYVLKPTTYLNTLESISRMYERIETRNIAFSDFGNSVYGSYKKGETVFRSDIVKAFKETMELADFDNIAFRNPNLYAMKYASSVTDIDLSSANYQIITYSIPFYQLVFSGLIDYSGKPFNTTDEFSYQYHIMKALETGANISMMWSYESTVSLLETEYSMYYSTYYEYWFEKLVETFNILNNTEVFKRRLINHEVLSKDGLVSKSTYEDGMALIFNYRDYPYHDGGISVQPNDFLIVWEVS